MSALAVRTYSCAVLNDNIGVNIGVRRHEWVEKRAPEPLV